MADFPTEWIASLQDRLKESDNKIDALGVHLDNKFQDLDGKLNKLTEQYHKIELALSNNWHETTQEVSKCRHTKNNELQLISNNAHLCKEERVKDHTDLKEELSDKIIEISKEVDTKITKLNDKFNLMDKKSSNITTELRVKLGLYIVFGSAIAGYLFSLLS